MRILHTFVIICLAALTAQAQTQHGYVKTKGRMEAGKVIAGIRLSGATVTVKGRPSALSDAQGNFSFPVTESSYYIQKVQKKGYELTDSEQLSRAYYYSAETPLVIVMERHDQQTADKLMAERKIRRTLSKQLQEREQEIEALKKEQRLTEAEYQQRLQHLYQSQEKNEKLISEMADRYARIDYDQVDQFNQYIYECILNGELTRADSLLKTRGELNSRIEELHRHRRANAEEAEKLAQREANLSKSITFAQQKLEEIGQDCYNHFEIEKLRHRNDSAAYYIELRASLDTTNISWQTDAGEFLLEYLAQYDKAIEYLQRALRWAKQEEEIATICNAMGLVYYSQSNYPLALEYINNALEIRLKTFGESHKRVVESYNNIGMIYKTQVDYSQALKYYNKALEVAKKVYGERHSEIGGLYNNIGFVYAAQRKKIEALDYYNKALSILRDNYGEESPHVAIAYSGIGITYNRSGEQSQALEYFDKGLNIFMKVYGENHPLVANTYHYIGGAYYYLGFNNQEYFSQALDYYTKALGVQCKILGKNHLFVAYTYLSIGMVYEGQGDYTQALDYCNKALPIFMDSFGDKNHPNVIECNKIIERIKERQ